MRPKLVLALLTVVAYTPAWAIPRECVKGTLASYIRLGANGCTLGGVTYADFAYFAQVSGGARAVKAEEIAVTPLPIVPGESRLGFSAPWKAAKGQGLDSTISYRAVLPRRDTLPALLELNLGHVAIGGIIGAVSVDESTNVGDLSVFGRCADACEAKARDSRQFHPVGVVRITDHVKLTGGNDGASLDKFESGMNLCLVCG